MRFQTRSIRTVGWFLPALALLLALVVTAPAYAGGWAVITLDELPTDVTTDKPLTIGFTVRQHGVTLLDGLYPTVTARSSSGEEVAVQAAPGETSGHYVATLTFPEPGTWELSVQAFTMDQPMPALTVLSPGESAAMATARVEPRMTAISPLLAVRGLAFGMALLGMLLIYRRSRRLGVALTATCLLVGAGTFFMGAGMPVEAQSSSSPSAAAQIELGRQLFLAKGCITCHVNDRAASRSEYWTIEMGAPDLSRYSSHPDVLFVRLKDPAAAKSDTKMPNLGLKKEEIEALIAFLNAD